MNRSILSRALLAAATATFAAAAVHAMHPGHEAAPAAAPGAAAWKGKNLKVLPADMPRDQVIAVMRSFSAAMGKDCTFCHDKGADGKMDPSLDTNAHKKSARWMMTMVKDLNAKFGVTDMSKAKVSCYTCHRGDPHPLTSAAPKVPRDPAMPEGHLNHQS